MSLQQFPGFIDVHVHLRDPGATHKEDFMMGSRAAVKGGFTYIIDMPNNPIPTVSVKRLQEKILSAKRNSLCDIGFHYGTDGKNMSTFAYVWHSPSVFGLKIYCNHTTGDLLIEDKNTLNEIFKSWNSTKPILVHAEKDALAVGRPRQRDIGAGVRGEAARFSAGGGHDVNVLVGVEIPRERHERSIR